MALVCTASETPRADEHIAPEFTLEREAIVLGLGPFTSFSSHLVPPSFLGRD